VGVNPATTTENAGGICPNIGISNHPDRGHRLAESFHIPWSQESTSMEIHGIIYSCEKEDETKVCSGSTDCCGDNLRCAGNSGDIRAHFAYDSLSSACGCMLLEKFTKIL